MIDDFLDDSVPQEMASKFSLLLEDLYNYLHSVARESRLDRQRRGILPGITDLFGQNPNEMSLKPCIRFLAYIYDFIRVRILDNSGTSVNIGELSKQLSQSLTELDLCVADQALFFLHRPKTLTYLIYAVLITKNTKPIADILNYAHTFPHYEQLKWFAGYILKMDIPFEDTSYHQHFVQAFTELRQIPRVDPKHNFPVALLHPIDILFSIYQLNNEILQKLPEPIMLKKMDPDVHLLQLIFQLQGSMHLIMVFTDPVDWLPFYNRINAMALCLYQKPVDTADNSELLARIHNEFMELLMKESLKHLIKYANDAECVGVVARFLLNYDPKSFSSILYLHKNRAALTQIFLRHALYDEAYHLLDEVESLFQECTNYGNPAILSLFFPGAPNIEDTSKVKLHMNEIKWFSFYCYLLDNVLRQKMTIDNALNHPDFQRMYLPYKELKHKVEGSFITNQTLDNLRKLAAIKTNTADHRKICLFYEYVKPGLTQKEIKELDACFSLIDGLFPVSGKKNRGKPAGKKYHEKSKNQGKTTTSNGKSPLTPAQPTDHNPSPLATLEKKKRRKKKPDSTLLLAPSTIEAADDQGEAFILPQKKTKPKKEPAAYKSYSGRVKKRLEVKNSPPMEHQAHKANSVYFFSGKKKKQNQDKKTVDPVLDRQVQLPDELIEFFRPFFNGWTRFYLTGAAVYELKIQKDPFDYDVIAIGISASNFIRNAELLRLNPKKQGNTHSIVKVSLPSGKVVEITCIEKTPVDAMHVLYENYKSRDLKNAAMFIPVLQEKKQVIIDFEGSFQCCRDRILQTVSPPMECWNKDILRLFRLAKWMLKFPEMRLSKEIQHTLNNPEVPFLELFYKHQETSPAFRGRIRTALDALLLRFGMIAVTRTLFECGILHSLLACTKKELSSKLELIENNLSGTYSVTSVPNWFSALFLVLREHEQSFYKVPLLSLTYLKPEEQNQLKELSENGGKVYSPNGAALSKFGVT